MYVISSVILFLKPEQSNENITDNGQGNNSLHGLRTVEKAENKHV